MPTDNITSRNTFICPRAPHDPAGVFVTSTPAHWRPDHTCSICGSLNPDDALRLMESGVEVIPTDKSYKVYLGMEHRKVYFQHFTPEQQQKFIELHNSKRMVIGYPGRFYVRPFFCAPVTKEDTHG